MNSFRYWHDEIADIPHKDEKTGEWVDLETGFRYKDWEKSQNSEKRERTAYEQKKHDLTVESRKTAKVLGGKALKGSLKQKAWAEEIRKKILVKATTEQAEIILNSTLCSHSKFWIETRNKSCKEIIDYLCEMPSLIKEANELIREFEWEINKFIDSGGVIGSEKRDNNYLLPLGFTNLVLSEIRESDVNSLSEKYGLSTETLSKKIAHQKIISKVEELKRGIGLKEAN